MKNLIKSAIEKVRGKGVEATDDAAELLAAGETVQGLNAWHTYEHPVTGDRLRVYNGSDQSMPLEMDVRGHTFAHIAPFGGEPADPASLKTDDLLFRKLTMAERSVLVEIRLKAAKAEARVKAYKLKPDNELRRMWHQQIAKDCGVTRVE